VYTHLINYSCVAARLLDCHFFSATPAPLGKSCVSTGGPPNKVNISYNALTDPHLYDYFVRKLQSMDPLMPAQPSQVNVEDSVCVQATVIYTVKNICISMYILWQVFCILMEPVPYMLVWVN